MYFNYTVIYNIIIVLFYYSYIVIIDMGFLCVFFVGVLYGDVFFYNRKSVLRVIRERSFTKKPPVLTIPVFTIYQSMEATNTCSSV